MSAPHSVRNDRQAGELLLQWVDGRELRLSHASLRHHCHCAFCRARQLRGDLMAVPADVRVTGMSAQGYGLQLIFSDGHDKGIFPWAYLLSLREEAAAASV